MGDSDIDSDTNSTLSTDSSSSSEIDNLQKDPSY